MYLIQDYEVSNECKGSNLWEYILVSTILMFPNSSVKTDNFTLFAILVIIIGIINLCMCIWGGIELWVKSFDSLVDSNIWVFGTWTFGLQMTSCFFCLTTILTLCCKLITASDEENKEPNLTSIV